MSSVSRGPANQAVYFLKYFHPQATPKCAANMLQNLTVTQIHRSLIG